MPALTDLFIPKHTHFGLSIGRTWIRAVEVSPENKVRTAAEIQIPEGIFKDGVLVNTLVFKDLLHKLVAAGKFSSNYVMVCFPEVYAYSREHNLPLIPLSDVREAISYQVKDLFPFPEEDIYFDWKLVEQSAENLKVVVVAIQKKILDTIVPALIDIGLKPVSFEPGASALSRLLVFNPGQHAIVTEINYRGAYVSVVAGKKTLFTTIVNHPQGETDEVFFTNINQTVLEVITYYKNKGILAEKNTTIVLTGDLASTQFADKMKPHFPYPIELLMTAISNPAFNKAFAVAISPIAPPEDENSINLLPPEIQKKYDRERESIFYRNLFGRSGIVLGIFLVCSIMLFAFLTFERQRLESRVKSITDITASQKPDTQKLLLLNAQAKNIVELAQMRKTARDKLQVITNLLPPTIHITQWEFDDTKQQFILQGEAESRTDLLDFKSKLDASDEFDRITLPLDSLELARNSRFSISFLVKE